MASCAEAVDLLRVVGGVIADRCVWTCHARAARRFLHHFPSRLEGKVERKAWEDEGHMHQCSPWDSRAAEWSVTGMLEFAADHPDDPLVVLALDLLKIAGRGWTISRVEEELRHDWVVWTIASAVVLGRSARLSPRGARPTPKEESALRQAERGEEPPPTLRSSEIRVRRKRAA